MNKLRFVLNTSDSFVDSSSVMLSEKYALLTDSFNDSFDNSNPCCIIVGIPLRKTVAKAALAPNMLL